MTATPSPRVLLPEVERTPIRHRRRFFHSVAIRKEVRMNYAQQRRAAIFDVVQVIDEIGFDKTVDALSTFVESEVKSAFTRGVRTAKTKPEKPATQKREAA
jgi:hypothetical protein